MAQPRLCAAPQRPDGEVIPSRPSFSSMGTVVKLLIQSAALALAATIASHTFAEAEPPATLAEAVSHFSEYNKRLDQSLTQELTSERMMEIHELTYTLQAALAMINEEMDGLADTLEEIHIASEARNAEDVESYGADYLKTARAVIK